MPDAPTQSTRPPLLADTAAMDEEDILDAMRHLGGYLDISPTDALALLQEADDRGSPGD